MVTLTRDDMIDGLRDVVARLHARGSSASIRIIGGAAMLLRYDADRRVTPDIDASIQSNDDIDAIVRAISDERGWPTDWLNSKAATFAPIAAEPLWEPLHDDDQVSICVATPGSLLAMKLRAARPARDIDDIATLLAILEIDTADEAEAVFEHYFPGELPPDRAYRLIDTILAAGLPEVPSSPSKPTFG